MAKASNRTVPVPEGVDVALNASSVTVKGKHGELTLDVKGGIDVTQENGDLAITPRSSARNEYALAGTYQALLRNMVRGVTDRWGKAARAARYGLSRANRNKKSKSDAGLLTTGGFPDSRRHRNYDTHSNVDRS